MDFNPDDIVQEDEFNPEDIDTEVTQEVHELTPVVKRSFGEEFADTAVGTWLGDMALTVRDYGRSKKKDIEAVEQASEDFFGVDLPVVDTAAGLMVSNAKDVANVGIKAGEGLAELILSDLPAMVVENIKNLSLAESGGSNEVVEDTLDTVREDLIEFGDTIDTVVTDTKNEAIPFLEEDEATDKVTDVAAILGGGIAGGTRKIAKEASTLEKVTKEAVGAAAGSVAVQGRDTAFEPLTAELLGIEADSPEARRGLNFLEEAGGGAVADFVLRSFKPIANKLKSYYNIETPDVAEQVAVEAAEYQKGMDALGEQELLPPEKSLYTPEEQLDNITDVDTDVEVDFMSDVTPSQSKPERIKGALTEHYKKKRDTTQGGVAIQRMYTTHVDEMRVLHDAERVRRQAEGIIGAKDLSDAEWQPTKRITQSARTWSNNAIGGDRAEKFVKRLNEDGTYDVVPDVYNYTEIVMRGVDNGASMKEMDELLSAHGAISDYVSIDAQQAQSAADIVSVLSDAGVKLPREFGQELGEFINNVTAATKTQTDELYQPLLDAAETNADTIRASLRKNKVKKAVFDDVNTKLDDMLTESAHSSYMTREEAERIMDSYKGKEWTQPFMDEYSALMKFALNERVVAGEVSEEAANRMLKLRPGHVPAYRVVKNATGTSERGYNIGSGESKIKHKRKISAKTVRLPSDTIPEYLDAVGRGVENARIRRNILDYYTNNFDGDIVNVFREPVDKIQEAVAKLEAGTRKQITTDELLPYSTEVVEQRGDVVKFNVNGGTLELTVMDKELYGVLARSSTNRERSALANIYRTIGNISRVPVVTLRAPLIAQRELRDSAITSNLPLFQRINPTRYIRAFGYKETNPEMYDKIMTDLGLENAAGLLESDVGLTKGQAIRDMAGGKGNIKRSISQGIHDWLNRWDAMVRIAEYEGLRKQGYDHAQAISIVKERGVNFTQRGMGIDPKSATEMTELLYREYRDARASGDKEAIRQTRRTLGRWNGSAGVTIPGKLATRARYLPVALFNNSIAYAFIQETPFARTFVNSTDTLFSRLRYQKSKILPGLALYVLGNVGLKVAVDGPAELFNRSTQSEAQYQKSTNFTNGVDIPHGYLGRTLGMPAEELLITSIAAMHEVLPDRVREITREAYPELAKAMDEYDPANNNIPLAMINAAFSQFRFESLPETIVRVGIAGKDHMGNDIVSPYLDTDETPSYLKTNPQVPYSWNRLMQDMHTTFGMSMSPAKTYSLFNSVTGGAFGIAAQFADYYMNVSDIGPELRKLKMGERFLISSNLSTEQVVPDEWKVQEQYYNMVSVAKDAYEKFSGLEERIELKELTKQDAIDFYNKNKELLDLYEVTKQDYSKFRDLAKEERHIMYDLNPLYVEGERKFSGSATKTAGLDNLRRKRYTIMKTTLDSISSRAGGDRLLDSFTGRDSKASLLLAPINTFNDGLEDVSIPNQAIIDEVESIDWDAVRDMDTPPPTSRMDYGIRSEHMLELSDISGLEVEDIISINKVVGEMTGIDPNFLTSLQYAESGLRDVDNELGASSASGYNQMTDYTWKLAVDAFGEPYGITEDMRGNAFAETLMTAALIRDDTMAIAESLGGKKLTPVEQYAIHHFGRSEAKAFIKANRSASSARPITSVLGDDAISANPHIVHPKGDNNELDKTNYRTIRQVYKELERRLLQYDNL